MSFAEKLEAAGDELEKEIKDGCAMILIATDRDDEPYVNIMGNRRSLSALLSFAALKSNGFEEILRNSIKAIEIYRDKHNK